MKHKREIFFSIVFSIKYNKKYFAERKIRAEGVGV